MYNVAETLVVVEQLKEGGVNIVASDPEKT